MNLYTDIPGFTNDERSTFNVVVEITKWSSNKIEYNEDEGYFFLDRALYQSTFYPFDYGFIPQTEAGDGDAIDVCLLTTHSVFPGCVVQARPIGMLATIDQDGEDYKVIAVPVSKVDPRFDEVKTWEDLPTHVQKEFLIYFKEYKHLEVKKYGKISIGGFKWVEETLTHIHAAGDAFEKNHNA